MYFIRGLFLLSTYLFSSLAANAMDDDIKFSRMMLERISLGKTGYERSFEEFARNCSSCLGEGCERRLIIGRGNADPEIHPHALPGDGEENVVWIYTDVSRSKYQAGNAKPGLWIDFDNVKHVKLIPDNFFSEVGFDWSTLKFFNNLDDIIVEIHRILAVGGKLTIPAGEQTGMISLYPVTLQIAAGGYPVSAIQSFNNAKEAREELTRRQKAYLISIFGEENVTEFSSTIYPLAPEKDNAGNGYFEARKK